MTPVAEARTIDCVEQRHQELVMSTMRLGKIGIGPQSPGLRSAFILCCISTLWSFSSSAYATPPAGFKSDVLAVGAFDEIHIVNAGDADVKIKTNGNVDVHMLLNTFGPGGYIGWHRHPGPSLVSVKSGVATYYSGDDPTCTPRRYEAGDGFIDPGDDVHNLRNEASTVLEVVVVSIVPEGAPRRIDEPAPGNCPF
jgi:quercetin dioxygenase-like cupin family protein